MKAKATTGGANKYLAYSTSKTKNSNSQTLIDKRTGRGTKQTQTRVPGGVIKSGDSVRVSPKKSTGRSADASASAAVVKKATSKARATGQTKSSAMDAVTRRYKPNNELYTDGKNTRLFSTVDDKLWNRGKSSKAKGMRMTEKVLRTGPAKVTAKKK